MKKTRLTILSFGVFAAVVFATNITPYDNAKPPSLALPVAYERAMSALGSATNQFHCLKAQVTTDFGADGEWQFEFYSTNSPSRPKWVTVEFNGKIHVEDLMLR
jgi:hypothetical protein